MKLDPNASNLSRKERRASNYRLFIPILLALLIIGSVGAYVIFNRNDSVSGPLPAARGRMINLLVLGVDEREGDVGRSDTIFVVAVDPNESKMTIISLPRDSRVRIPKYGWDKINHAYSLGGTELTKTTVENLLGIRIDYTAIVNCTGFIRMIDAMGGVSLDVEKRMKYADLYDDNGGLYIDLKPGVQRLNGKMAIEYVRYRDEEGDIGRIARQQKFLKAFMKEFANPQLITRLPELIKELSSAVKIDMPFKEMLSLIPIVSNVANSGINTEWIAGTPIWIQDVSYWLPDIKEVRGKVAQIQGIAADEQSWQTTELLANEYKRSIPREIKVADVPPIVRDGLRKESAVPKVSAPTEPQKTKLERIQTQPKEKVNADTKITPPANRQDPVMPTKEASNDKNSRQADKEKAINSSDRS